MRVHYIRILASLLFILSAILFIERPGIQYDEILFSNAALGGLDETFIKKEIKGVPVLLMPYIGALKSYLYYPIFAIFGVNALSIRLPMILLMAIGIQFVFSIFKNLNPRLAVWATLLFALQPSIVMFTRTDVGPSAIETFLKLAVLSLLASAYSARTLKHLPLISVLCLLGAYNKLNYIWFTNAVFGAFSIILVGRVLLVYIKNKKIELDSTKGFLLAVAAYLPSFIYFITIEKSYGVNSTFSFSAILDSVPKKIYQFQNIITGMSYPRYALGVNVSFWQRPIALMQIAIAAAGLIAFFPKYRNLKPYRAPFLFIALCGALTVAQVILTKEATNPWHALAIEPFFTLSSALSVWILYKASRSHYSRSYTQFLAKGLAGIIVLYSLIALMLNIKAVKSSDGTTIWSTAIYELIEYTATTDGTFFSGDWGFHTQLLAFNQNPDKFKNLLPVMNYGSIEERIRYFDDMARQNHGSTYIIFHPEPKSIFPKIKTDLCELALNRDRELTLDRTFQDSKGTVRYEIYELR